MQLYLSLEVARNIRLRKSWLNDRYDIDSGNLYFTFKLSSDQTISNAFLLLFVFASRCGRSEKKLIVYFSFYFLRHFAFTLYTRNLQKQPNRACYQKVCTQINTNFLCLVVE